jgi:hypothetical protein
MSENNLQVVSQTYFKEGSCPKCGAGIYVTKPTGVDGGHVSPPAQYFTCGCRIMNGGGVSITNIPVTQPTPSLPYVVIQDPSRWVTPGTGTWPNGEATGVMPDRGRAGDFPTGGGGGSSVWPNVIWPDDNLNKTFCGSGGCSQPENLKVRAYL